MMHDSEFDKDCALPYTIVLSEYSQLKPQNV